MRRRNLDPNTPETPAGNHAFEHLLIDPMNADEEEDKDRQFVTALARGLDESQAIAFGQAAAALSVTRAGAQPSIPTLAQVEQVLS